MEADDEGGEAWADILARCSQGGRVVDELHRAEEAVLTIQNRILAAIEAKRGYAKDYEAFEAALAEVDRMRRKVYRLARQ